MKFSVERDVLADAVAWAARALPLRPSAPVLAGILIEARPQDGWAVLGVGLNLSVAEFPEDLRDRAISLFGSAPPAVPYGRVTSIRNSWAGVAAGTLSERLGVWLEADAEAVLGAWRARDALFGREVSWDKGTGVADGVDGGGGDLARHAVVAGDAAVEVKDGHDLVLGIDLLPGRFK